MKSLRAQDRRRAGAHGARRRLRPGGTAMSRAPARPGHARSRSSSACWSRPASCVAVGAGDVSAYARRAAAAGRSRSPCCSPSASPSCWPRGMTSPLREMTARRRGGWRPATTPAGDRDVERRGRRAGPRLQHDGRRPGGGRPAAPRPGRERLPRAAHARSSALRAVLENLVDGVAQPDPADAAGRARPDRAARRARHRPARPLARRRRHRAAGPRTPLRCRVPGRGGGRGAADRTARVGTSSGSTRRT